MRFTSLIAAFLASAQASASPEAEASLMDSLADGEAHVFKRDADVSPHVTELAERDNIDLSQMFRHAMIKRDDGEHVTIWVHNSYDEHNDTDVGDESDVSLTKRQSVRPSSGFDDRANGECFMNTARYRGDTGPGAPFTGGAAAIVNWASGRRGRWHIAGSAINQDIIVAGSNSGANTRFTIRSDEGMRNHITRYFGTSQLASLVRTSRERYQRVYSGRERVRVHGNILCQTIQTSCYKNLCQPVVGRTDVYWSLDNWNGRI